MLTPNPQRVAQTFAKEAGEVRFVKDRGSDKSEWGWGSPGPSERDSALLEEFVFNPKFLKPLALTLRSLLMALGHATSAHARFVKIKSRTISPDGALGGKGYIQKIPDMRRQLMNSVEVLSSLTDTIHDEILAPHWAEDEDKLDPRDRDEVKQIVEEVEEIKDDPEGWAIEEEEEESEEAEETDDSLARMASRLGSGFMYLPPASSEALDILRSDLSLLKGADRPSAMRLLEEAERLVYKAHGL